MRNSYSQVDLTTNLNLFSDLLSLNLTNWHVRWKTLLNFYVPLMLDKDNNGQFIIPVNNIDYNNFIYVKLPSNNGINSSYK